MPDMYKLTNGASVILLPDTYFVPVEENPTNARYQAWLAGGGVPLPADEPVAAERRVKDWEFRDRFSKAELMAIVGAAYAGDDTARWVLLKIQTASDGVNLDSTEVVGSLDYLTAAGILAPGRKAAILA